MHFVLNQPLAVAKELASGSGSRVNKDPSSLLRYGLPIPPTISPSVRSLQSAVEGVKGDVTSKRFSAAKDGVKKARGLAKSKKGSAIGASVIRGDGNAMISSLDSVLAKLDAAIGDAQGYERGSEQERAALDVAYKLQDEAAGIMGEIEEGMVPESYEVKVPGEYEGLPRLKGRAEVVMTFKKAGGAPFDINGVNYPKATMRMVIDGYTAPVTGGNFVELVKKGFYNDMEIQRSDGFVVQTGKPKDGSEGYVGDGGPSVKQLGKGSKGERLIPLEIFVSGDKQAVYEETIEDNGRGGQATVLPFSSYGAMGWAREEYDANSGSSQFFWLLFDSDLTPAGKNVLDGRYSSFGYVVEGEEFLRDIKEGDIITEAKVEKGGDMIKYE
ncbi:hypothetical protein TrRE_jg132 [Triparma retinervis]|uniref:peptidylprolyl isomerase n=1 Tax=Triparma retinervis TaxID=2557542 RepID=A0A9W7G8L0_9STRA|nr:hypothetical protein TrRE_jg132 [Triparma retinervis]